MDNESDDQHTKFDQEEAALNATDGLLTSLSNRMDGEELWLTTKITYYKDRPFKAGSDVSGTADLYEGFFNGIIPIALKRYQNVDKQFTKEIQRDVDILCSKDNSHPNFIRYFGHVDGTDHTYIVTELCECSVADIIDPKRKKEAQKKTQYFDSILINLSHKEILEQSSEAVCFLHSRNLIHRNLHSENFLMACVDPKKNDFLVKLTDFQFTKDINVDSTDTGSSRKDGWVAPEGFKNWPFEKNQLTTKFDSFILGCYFFYVLSGGSHPFGENVSAQRTGISSDQHDVYKDEWNGGSEWQKRTNTPSPQNIHYEEETEWALNVIKDLIKYKDTDRKSVQQILESKYFLPESYIIYGNPTNNGPEKPGLCVILTQEMYYNPMEDLDYLEDYSGTEKYDGVELDGKKLEETFQNFGYDILRLRNLQAEKIETLLSPEELVKRTGISFKKYASLVVCILGHGNKGVVSGVDGKAVSLNQIQYDAFDEQGCPDLSGKPKIFIVLACQGSRKQKVMLTERQNYSVRYKVSESYENQAPPVYDFIRLSSTIEEYMSQMYYGTGSVFIQSLCKALQNEYKDPDPGKKERYNRDLTQIFTTFVTPSVALSGTDFKQTPEFRSSLSKMIRFRQRNTSGDRGVVFEPGPGDNGAISEAFKTGRSSYEKKGYTKRKLISENDYNSLLETIILVVEAGGREGNSLKVYQAVAWLIRNRYYLNKHKSLRDSCEQLMRSMELDGSQTGPKIDAIMRIEVKKSISYTIYDEPKDPTFGAIYFKIQNYNGQQLPMPEYYKRTLKIGNYEFYRESPHWWEIISNCNIS